MADKPTYTKLPDGSIVKTEPVDLKVIQEQIAQLNAIIANLDGGIARMQTALVDYQAMRTTRQSELDALNALL